MIRESGRPDFHLGAATETFGGVETSVDPWCWIHGIPTPSTMTSCERCGDIGVAAMRAGWPGFPTWCEGPDCVHCICGLCKGSGRVCVDCGRCPNCPTWVIPPHEGPRPGGGHEDESLFGYDCQDDSRLSRRWDRALRREVVRPAHRYFDTSRGRWEQ